MADCVLRASTLNNRSKPLGKLCDSSERSVVSAPGVANRAKPDLDSPLVTNV